MKLGGEPVASLALFMVIWVIFAVLSSVTDGVQHAPHLAPFPVWLKDPCSYCTESVTVGVIVQKHPTHMNTGSPALPGLRNRCVGSLCFLQGL